MMIARWVWRTWLRLLLGSEFIGTTAAIIGGLAAAGSSVAGGAMASSAAKKAAKTQADTALQVAQLQSEDAQKALDFQKQQYGDQLRFLSPYYNTGTSALGRLGFLMGLNVPNTVLTPGGAFPQPAQPGGAGVMTTGDRTSPTFKRMPLPANTDTRQTTAPLSGSVATNRMLPSGTDVSSAGPAGGGFALNKFVSPAEDSSGTGGGSFITNGDMPAGFLGPPDQNPASIIMDPNTGLPSLNQFLVTPEDQSGFGSLMTPWSEPFQAPTDVTEQSDPGFQFRLKQGQEALERSAAARGNLLTGGTAKDLTNYAQDYASNEYNNVYNRALNQYQQRYNIFQQNQANQFNRLASLTGLGQTSAGQLSSAGQNAANSASSILMNSGQQIGNALNDAAAARASGYMGSGNAWNGVLGGLGDLGMLGVLMGRKR
jgi:hypothetical protein